MRSRSKDLARERERLGAAALALASATAEELTADPSTSATQRAALVLAVLEAAMRTAPLGNDGLPLCAGVNQAVSKLRGLAVIYEIERWDGPTNAPG